MLGRQTTARPWFRRARRLHAGGRQLAFVEPLEPRRLMCVDHQAAGGGDPLTPTYSLATSSVAEPVLAAAYATVTSTVPALHSRPGARATLFLDFDGIAASLQWGSWYTTTPTPAYRLDADATSFTEAELAGITEIWARVAEKFSPFDINVTTVDPGAYPDLHVLRVVIGGTGGWTNATGVGGVAYLNSFNGTGAYDDLNTVWVFSDNYGGYAPDLAEAAAHEAGHAFGLYHQSTKPSLPFPGREYSLGNPSDSSIAPLMGASYYADRGLWWRGDAHTGNLDPYTGQLSAGGYWFWQDDLAVLAGTAFGYRVDDHGDTPAGAGAMTVVGGTALVASGVIERNGDADGFWFSTGGGAASFYVTGAPYGQMLDVRVMLYNAAGTLVASVDPGDSLDAVLTANLAAGRYRLVVAGHSLQYGDLGQYFVAATVPPPTAPAAAAAVAAARTGNAVTVTWADVSNDEAGFRVERSGDGGATWSTVGAAAANATSLVDSEGGPGRTYRYRVVAVGLSVDAVAVAAAEAVTLAPSVPGLAKSATSAASAVLAWQDVLGETAYRLERSLAGSGVWGTLATLSADATGYTDASAAPGSTYLYRLTALNDGGEATGEAVTVTTPYASGPLVSPAEVAVARTSRGAALSWVDCATAELGYRVERSTNGGKSWKLAGVTKAGTTRFSDTKVKLAAGANVTYRVSATAAGGSRSVPTTTTPIILPPAKPSLATKLVAGKVRLSWRDVAGETGYRLERDDGSGWQALATVGANRTSFTDASSLGGGKKYQYRLVATNAGGASAASKVAAVEVRAVAATWHRGADRDAA